MNLLMIFVIVILINERSRVCFAMFGMKMGWDPVFVIKMVFLYYELMKMSSFTYSHSFSM